MGIRWKLSAAIAVVSTLVTLALSIVVHSATRQSMIENSRDVQDERLQFVHRVYDSTARAPFGAKVDDPKLPDPLRRAVESGERATYVQQTDGAPIVWAATPLGDGTVLSLRTRFTDSYPVLADLDRALVIGSLSLVVGSCALAVALGGQLSRRLRKAAQAAGEVAAGETSVRVREAVGARVRDETDELAGAVDAMADALQGRLEAERRVTADIAHELRTPVTGLLTAAELLPPGRPTELVRDRAQALRQLVEDVLEVARLDGVAERADLQEVRLGLFVPRRVRAHTPDAVVRVTEDATVWTDPRRLERILGNLLGNAARYGRPPVEVTVDGRTLRVRDHGPGFPAALLADGPSRFRTGSRDRSGRGHGLGLTIAAGQARVLGAELALYNADETGATASGDPSHGASDTAGPDTPGEPGTDGTDKIDKADGTGGARPDGGADADGPPTEDGGGAIAELRLPVTAPSEPPGTPPGGVPMIRDPETS
ncbi:HAMP domain-containing histidine kinase [Streptomyces sp. AJS327]|uniref:sensor histidine kinase n=1 Tax=Streptomyces sp. AJS327 TaxID=2545265 RepID=UPI0015DD5C2B|nr:HAMP domain-containing sensor histidine kinase [Streptomyces sp. AJS327]MBA0053831.1 HAMP domain-containing histidine kinase [Streptomyces sp. AJS327]